MIAYPRTIKPCFTVQGCVPDGIIEESLCRRAFTQFNRLDVVRAGVSRFLRMGNKFAASTSKVARFLQDGAII